jgi:hypothetical protein
LLLFESLHHAIDEGIVLASLGPSAKGGAQMFKVLQLRCHFCIAAKESIATSDCSRDCPRFARTSPGGEAQMFKVLQLRCHFFVFIAHSSKLESHETKKIPLRS